MPQADAADILASTEKLSRSIDQMASNMGSAASRPAPAEMESPGNGSSFLPIGGGRGGRYGAAMGRRMGRTRPSTAKESSDPIPAPSKSQPLDTRQTSSTVLKRGGRSSAKQANPFDPNNVMGTKNVTTAEFTPSAVDKMNKYVPPERPLAPAEMDELNKLMKKESWSPPGTWDGQ